MNREMYESSEYIAKNPRWHTEDSLWKVKQIIKIIDKNQNYSA